MHLGGRPVCSQFAVRKYPDRTSIGFGNETCQEENIATTKGRPHTKMCGRPFASCDCFLFNGFPSVSLIDDDSFLINLTLEIFIDGKIIPFVENCRVAADARIALRRFLHFEIDVNVAPRIAERRDAAAENDDFPDVRVVLANINHPPDVCLLRREDAYDVLIRFCKYVPHARERNCRHHHHLILFYQNTLILSFARKYQSDAPMAIAVIIPSCK